MTEEAKYKPTTFWLADPRNGVRLFNPDTQDWLVFTGGSYTAQTQQEHDLIVRELGHKAWEEDMTKAPAPNPISGYAPKSSDALNAHIELITPVRN